MTAAKEKGPSPGSLAALRLLLFLVVTLFLPETRVWAFAAATTTAPGQLARVSASSTWENAGAIAYDASDCSVAAKSGNLVQGEFDFVNSLPAKPPINWPPNRGFLGTPETTTLQPGTLVDRFGYDGGTFVSPKGTPYIQRSLAPGTQYKPYNVYEVVKPFDVQTGQVAPAFDMPGLGIQHELPGSVKSLLESGHIRLVPSG